MLGQPMTTYLLHRVPIGYYLGVNVFGWGVCILLAITSTSFGAIGTSRFFLGMFEAAVNPCLTTLVGQYYLRKEHAFRSTIWWSGAGLGSFVGDILAYGVGHGHGKLSVWKYLFIIFGGFSTLWSIVIVLFVPASPWKLKGLTEREQKIIVLRVSAPPLPVAEEAILPTTYLTHHVRSLPIILVSRVRTSSGTRYSRL